MPFVHYVTVTTDQGPCFFPSCWKNRYQLSRTTTCTQKCSRVNKNVVIEKCMNTLPNILTLLMLVNDLLSAGLIKEEATRST